MIKVTTKIKILFIFNLLLFFNISGGYCQEESYSWDFSNCEIKDILFAISVDTGITIVSDDTVSGEGDFQFSDGDFNAAFDAFLKRCRLYVSKKDNIWTVSKFNFNSVNNDYFLDCYDLYPFQILEKLAERVEWVITYDNLPNQKLSIHFKGLNKEQLVESIAKYFGEYDVVPVANGYHFKKSKIENTYDNINSNINISKNLNTNAYYIDVKESSFFEILDNFFQTGKTYGDEYNYCILSSNDNNVCRSLFYGPDFETTLNIICNQNGYKAVFSNNIYYIITDGDVKNSLLEGDENWIKFSLSYVLTDEFIPLLSKKIANLKIIKLLDNASFLCKCTKEEELLIKEFISQIDIRRTVQLISLKYLKPAELLEFLPPSINKDSLFMADNNSQLYFRGTEEEYINIIEQINTIDKPVKRISYDLLILQTDENSQINWSSSFGAKNLKADQRTSMSAMLGSVLGFNLNVVGAFGLNFAAELQSSIEENSTRVFADTTLHGVSGKKISFQNTNTYRYRDNNLNPETGKPIYSGITKEIVTGIKIDVLGWVSGDGMITSTVTASISRQGIDTSGATGNPPPTSEKLVTTEVTGKSGEPVVLSGLLLSAENEGEKRSPFISKIPLIGNLFKNKNKTKEKSQMIIYLVPHVITPENEIKDKDLDDIYTDEWFEEKIIKIMEKIREA